MINILKSNSNFCLRTLKSCIRSLINIPRLLIGAHLLILLSNFIVEYLPGRFAINTPQYRHGCVLKTQLLYVRIHWIIKAKRQRIPLSKIHHHSPSCDTIRTSSYPCNHIKHSNRIINPSSHTFRDL